MSKDLTEQQIEFEEMLEVISDELGNDLECGRITKTEYDEVQRFWTFNYQRVLLEWEIEAEHQERGSDR